MKDFRLTTTPDFEDIIEPELRQEAIKWVKQLREDLEKYRRDNPNLVEPFGLIPVEAHETKLFGIAPYQVTAVIDWISGFFNITVEDLL